ncbi:hypothetical protein GCM10010211_51960 [Streptomyces albospinus]|uniref:Uncharacterized protein n=2 Tax=Streptomyces albospinus TaxID=285515 RepID=A0ABQ2VEB9_9ACTN|nr:hypothetical protein GCM10010211_51960 [Streptomyces albospinus]
MVLTVGSGAGASAPTGTGSVPAVAGQAAAAVQVAGNDKAARNFKDALQQFRKDHAAAPAKVKADAVARVKKEIASGQLATHLPEGAHLAIERARAVVGPDGTLLAIPIQGAGLLAASGLTVQIGKDGALHSNESQFKPTGPNSGVLTAWKDGVLTQHVSASGNGSSSPATGPVPKPTSGGHILQADFTSGGHIQQASGYWDDVKKCLDDNGVPGWVQGLIAAPCFAAGPACAAALSLYYSNLVATCLGM